MPIKEKGNVIISTMVFVTLISIIMSFLFKVMINNNEIAVLSLNKQDLYDVRSNEEDLIYKYMEELNKMKDKEEIENDDGTNHMFDSDFSVVGKNSELDYCKSDDVFILEMDGSEINIIKRKIDYKIKNESIILIPTYNYEHNY